ncbi:UDP-glucose 4-epimerase GalE [Polymorphobacter sp.]|uniref:UDP-glucose 4-epimerase GalE n=1 Tax=Polymorphobacter sp. TaxID=1909290 RepID=UPI003F711035
MTTQADRTVDQLLRIPLAQCPPVLITGGAGYIGSHAALALLDLGIKVVILDDMSTGSSLLVPPNAVFVRGQAGDAELVSRVIAEESIGAIMHFAASISVGDSVSQPAAYYRNNLVETLGLAETAVNARIRAMVFSSTAAVYAEGSSRPLRETDPLGPINPYGASKAMAETVLRDIARASPHALSLGILRYFNVAGADPLGRSGQNSVHPHHLIEIATQVATGQRDMIHVYGSDYPTEDGTGVRDYVHVSDVAAAHVLMLQTILAASGQSLTFNLGYGQGQSVLDVLSALSVASGRPLPYRFTGRREGDPASLVADASLAASLGWTPRYRDIATIVSHALAWEAQRTKAVAVAA